MECDFFTAGAVLQYPVVTGQITANTAQVAHLLETLNPTPHTLVVLPELWSCGFDYGCLEQASQQTPALVQQMIDWAVHWQIYLVGSLPAATDKRTNQQPTNRLFYVGATGLLGTQDKTNLFTPWQETQFLTPAQSAPHPLKTPHGCIGGLICYDLRFPALASEQAFLGAQLLCVSAQWPASRLSHWRQLLQARAIENQLFVIAANSCSPVPGSETELAGHSMIIHPSGKILAEANNDTTTLSTPLTHRSITATRALFTNVGQRVHHKSTDHKITTLPSLLPWLHQIRAQRSQLVLAYGIFNTLEASHVAQLNQARAQGDCLVVALCTTPVAGSEEKTAAPMNSLHARAQVLAGLAAVDYLIPFEGETPETEIKTISPEVLIKEAEQPNSTNHYATPSNSSST